MQAPRWMLTVMAAILAATPLARGEADESRKEDVVLEIQAEPGVDQPVIIRTEQLNDEVKAQLQKAQSQMKAAIEQQLQVQSALEKSRNWLQVHDPVARGFVRAPRKMEKGAFLGISASPVTSPLREHLRLPKGIGLIVDHVEDGSPAETAGIKQYDILHKLDDQLLINAHQFAVLVRSYKPGDTIEITIIREGESHVRSARLTEKEMPALDAAGGPWPVPPMLWQEPLKLDVKLPPSNEFNVVKSRIDTDGQKDIVIKDGKSTMIITKTKDGSRLKVHDASGQVTFDGPIDTEEQHKALPEDVRDKLRIMDDKLEIRGGRLGIRGDKLDLPHAKEPAPGATSVRTLRWSDDQYTLDLNVSRQDGKTRTTLKATDNNGKEVFSGPIDTPEQRDKLPDAIKQRLDSPAWKGILEELQPAHNTF